MEKLMMSQLCLAMCPKANKKLGKPYKAANARHDYPSFGLWGNGCPYGSKM